MNKDFRRIYGYLALATTIGILILGWGVIGPNIFNSAKTGMGIVVYILTPICAYFPLKRGIKYLKRSGGKL